MRIMENSIQRAFTLIELLVVIAIIAILAAILFPVFAQAKSAAKKAVCLSNIKQAALASVMYAGDFDDVLPRVDNNGNCDYDPDDPACVIPGSESPPDIDSLSLAPSETVQQGSIFYVNVIQPYAKSYQGFECPEIGAPDYRDAVNNITNIDGYPVDLGAPYRDAMLPIYQGGLPQITVNDMTVDWNFDPNWLSTNPSDPSFVPYASGYLSRVARPADNVLLVADSAYNFTSGEQYGVGFPFSNPFNPNTLCVYMGVGSQWYVHGGNRSQDPNFVGPNSGAVPQWEADEWAELPEFSGFANVAFCDGHAKSLRWAELERCDFDSADNYWIYTHWDPTF